MYKENMNNIKIYMKQLLFYSFLLSAQLPEKSFKAFVLLYRDIILILL